MIIKVLIAMVLLMIIFLAFRVFFGAEAPIVTTTASLDTAQLEKTLQKILEAQAKAPVMAVPTSGDAASAETLKSAGASSSSTVAELEALKKDLAEKEKLLIQVRNEAAKAAANASSASAGAVAAASNNSAIKLETKIKDLEARLAEYEIISEDIADLSFYKEENSRLQNELSTRRASGGGGSSGSSGGGQGVATEPISPPVAKASTPNIDFR